MHSQEGPQEGVATLSVFAPVSLGYSQLEIGEHATSTFTLLA